MHQDISKNYHEILAQISEACARVGRDPSLVRLVAVSKTVGAEEIAAAIAAGIGDFGENRTDQFRLRQEQFPEANWHFIGSIQTNKIKDIVGKAALIHSVSSERALVAIARRAQFMDVTQRLLIEVNISGEESKDGISPDQLDGLLDRAADLEGIEVRGLMTMAPQGDLRAARVAFRGLRELRDSFIASFGASGRIRLQELSMGMSEDFSLAVEEGATIVRVGRSIWL